MTSKRDVESASAGLHPPQFWSLDDLATSSAATPDSRLWTFRAQNSVVRVLLAGGRVALHRENQECEYMVVLVTDTSSANFVTNKGVEHVAGRAVVIVPPGESDVIVEANSEVIQLFGADATDLRGDAINALCYRQADPRVNPALPWPDPISGPALRVYPVDDYPKDPERLGRIFVSRIGMVNFFHAEDGPRDDARLTPHSHEDFEQCTVHLAGDYVHHVRTPWTPRLADWRSDEHRHLASPGVVIIPPTCVHTSQAIHSGAHQLIDLFAPPRLDWARHDGWVLNANDYPVADGLGAK